MKIKKVCLFFLWVLMVNINFTIWGLEEYEINFSKDQQIDSLIGNMKESFYISKAWDIEEIKLRLLFSNSPLINSQMSSITLTINDEYFYTVGVPDNKDALQQVEMDIPKKYLKEGINSLGIYTYMRVTDKLPCVDDANIANWIRIDKDSSIRMKYTVKKDYSSISEFYNRFIDIDTLRKNENIIMVSNKNDLNEIEAAVIALMEIAGQKLDKESIVQVKPLEDINNVKEKNIIYIGLYDNLLPNIKNKIDQEVTNKLENNVWMNLLKVSGDKNVLIITSKDGKLLKEAGLALGYKDLMNQYEGKKNLINYKQEIQGKNIEWQQAKQITINGEYLKGPFRQQGEYYINYPKDKCIAEGSQIYLDYRYSENLDFDKSLVTVYINEYPIGSKKLEKQNANKDSLTLSIPRDLNITGNFNIKVAFDLEQKDLWCTLRNTQEPWAYISEESMIKINSKEQQFMVFENYPHPFIKDNNINNLLIVIPEEPQIYIYKALSNIINILGASSQGNKGNVQIITSEKLNDDKRKKNIIAIGTYKENSFIRELNSELFFCFNNDGSKILGNEKLVIDDTYGEQLGTLQLLRSPFNNLKGIMTVTGPKHEGVVAASLNISTEKDLWKLYGDGILVDRQGEIKNYRFKEENDKKEPIIQQVINRKDIRNFIIVGVIILGLMVTAVILMVKKHFWKV